MTRHVVGTGRHDEGLQRIESFADGVIAIAITLLVLTLAEPPPDVEGARLVREVLRQWPHFLAYGISFVVVGRFWVVHHHLFRYVQRYDPGFLALNLAFLLTLAFLPYPTELLGDHSADPFAILFYAGSVAAASLASTALWIYATRGHRLVDPRLPEVEIRHVRQRSLVNGVVFLISIPLALVSPVLAYAAWASLIPIRFAIRAVHRRETAGR
ncbi:MAG TPA: TMEM175 family protein [Actinomycetota bacterium]|nr:TMEM175 family protein [Actinomycetota bacterium]